MYISYIFGIFYLVFGYVNFIFNKYLVWIGVKKDYYYFKIEVFNSVYKFKR